MPTPATPATAPAPITTTADEHVINCAAAVAAAGAAALAYVVASSPHLKASAAALAVADDAVDRLAGQGIPAGDEARRYVAEVARSRHAADVAAVVLGLRFRLTIAALDDIAKAGPRRRLSEPPVVARPLAPSAPARPDRYFAGEPAGDYGGLLDVAAWGANELGRQHTIRDLLTGRRVTAADFDSTGFLRAVDDGPPDFEETLQEEADRLAGGGS